MIVILTKDLMMSSSASAVARSSGATFKSVASSDKAVQVMTTESVTLVLIDLQMPGLDVEDIGAQLQGLTDELRPHSIAYAQHVNVDLLKSAKRIGFNEVLTRGQVNNGLGELFARFSATK